jgi:hypothetical protein
MSQWQQGDSFRTSASLAHDFLQSWSNQEESNTGAAYECWGPNVKASSFHYDAAQFGQFAQAQPCDTPLAKRFESQPKDETPLAARLEIIDRAESALRNDARDSASEGKDSQSPLSRIYDILDVHSNSSRWLEQRGYLEAFKSPDCTLDINFGTDARGSKVGAVMTAPDGTRRTVVACEGGVTFQRLTGANGQELVKFLSSGQIVELNPSRGRA